MIVHCDWAEIKVGSSQTGAGTVRHKLENNCLTLKDEE